MPVQRILIDVPVTGATFDAITNIQNNSREGITRLANYINGIASGSKSGQIRTLVNSVCASGTVTLNSFAAADYITINAVAFTARTSNPSTNEFLVGSTDEQAANNAIAVINASASNNIINMVHASRRGTLALSGFVNADYITINGVVFTGKTTPSSAVREQFKIGGSNTITAHNLAVAIGNSIDPRITGITATDSTGTVTVDFNGSLVMSASAHTTAANKIIVLTSRVNGTVGNLMTLAISARGSVSGANFSGGTAGTPYSFTTNY